MKVKNISGKTLNLKGGACKDGESAEVDFTEAKFLLGQGFVELFKEVVKPAPKPMKKPEVKKEEKTDG